MALTLYSATAWWSPRLSGSSGAAAGFPQVLALGMVLILFALIVVGGLRIALARVGEIGSAT